MSTTTHPATDLVSVFQEFCVPSGHPRHRDYGKPFLNWRLNGSDGSQTWADRMKANIGEEAYAVFHYCLCALDGAIFVAAMRCKPPGMERSMAGIPPKKFWVMESVEDRTAKEFEAETPVPEAGQHAIVTVLGRRIQDGYIAKIRTLPNSRFCGPVSDEGPVYFRFDGGVGMVMPMVQ